MNHYQKLLKQHKLPRQTEPAECFKEAEMNLDEEFASNKTLLQNAIIDQDEDLFNAVMGIGKDCATKFPDVNLPDRTQKRWTALHHAVFNSSMGGEQMVVALLKAGANPNIEDAEGKAPLNIAVDMGAMNLVELLLKNGARINMGGNLHIALLSDKPEVFSFLLKQEDIDLEFADEEGNTALHLAARLGYGYAIKEILEKAKSKGLAKRLVNLQNKSGNTPLHEAAIEGQEEAGKILCAAPEVDTQIENKKGQTAGQIKEEQLLEKETVEKEQQMSELRKRKKQQEKHAEKVVLGEKAQKLRKEDIEEVKENSLLSKPWVKCLILSAVLIVILYAFFHLYIGSRQTRLKSFHDNH